jgi:hypothetical protein
MLNAPSTISPYDDEEILLLFPGGSLGNEMINPLAQMAIRTMIIILNKLVKLWIDFKVTCPAFVVSSSIGFKAANSESNHLLYGSRKVRYLTQQEVQFLRVE